MSEIPIPSTSEQEARANELIARIRELTQALAGFTFAAKKRRRKIANLVSLPDEFFEQMAVACELYADVAAGGGLTAAECRSAISMSRAYGSVVQEMKTQAKGLDDTVAEYRANVGRRALRAYAVAQRINKEDDTRALIPHLDAIKRALGRGRPRKKAQEDPEAAAKKRNDIAATQEEQPNT